MNNLKSIHFPPPVADDMVRAILEGRKTVTRRVVKPQPTERPAKKTSADGVWRLEWWNVNEFHSIKIPYRPGDILYVQETWARIGYDVDSIWFEEPGQLYNGQIIYRADWSDGFPECRWHSSIHMTREAARIFLRVTDVRVERLHYMTRDEAVREGANPALAIDDFKRIWDSTVKKSDRARYGWDVNPYVWVIEFGRISKEDVA